LQTFQTQAARNNPAYTQYVRVVSTARVQNDNENSRMGQALNHLRV